MRVFYKLQFLVVLLTTSISFSQSYQNGVYVTNEGGFGAGNASVSFISNTNVLQNNIYSPANAGASLGDTAQSMFFEGSKAYIILNGSNAIKVINRYTLALETTITGVTNPRYMASFGGNLFVTCWGSPTVTTDDYVAIINANTNVITSTIAVGEGPENIVLNNSKLYVAQKGGYGYGNKVSVIDANTLAVLTPISVGDVPTSLAIDNGFLYILCAGKPSFSGSETFGSLVKYNLSTSTVVNTISFASTHPNNLKIVGSDMYYTINAAVYKSNINDAALPNTALFSVAPQGVYGIYSFNVIDAILYVADAGDYSNPGKVYTYSTAGSLLNSFTVGVIPNGFYKAEQNLASESFENGLQLSLYPNPTSDKFYLNTTENPSITIYDMSGRIILSQIYSQIGIDILSLKSSVYLVAIDLNGKKTVKYLTIK